MTSSVSTNTTTQQSGQKQFQKASDGYMYVFYVDVTDNYLYYRSSNDGGANWGTATKASHAALGYTVANCFFDGTYFWIAYQLGTSSWGGTGATLYGRRGTPSAGTITWDTQQIMLTSYSGYTQGNFCKTTNYVFFAHESSISSAYHIYVYRTTDGSSWTKIRDRTTMTDGGYHTVPQITNLEQRETDDVMIVTGLYASAAFYYSLWDNSAGTWDGPTYFAERTGNNYGSSWIRDLWTDNGVVYFVYLYGDTGGPVRLRSYTTSWSNYTTIDASTDTYPTLVNGNGIIYVFYERSSVIYYRTYTISGGAVGGETTFASESNITQPSSEKTAATYVSGSVGCIWFTGTANPYTLRYNQFALLTTKTKTYSIDVDIAKSNIPKTYPIDVSIISANSKPYNLDVALQRLGITLGYPIDVNVVSRKTLQYIIDAIIAKRTYVYSPSTAEIGFHDTGQGQQVYNNVILGTQATLSCRGKFTKITAYICKSVFNSNAKAGIYRVSDWKFMGGTPSVAITNSSYQWIDFTFDTPLELDAGIYAIVLMFDSNSTFIRFTNGVGQYVYSSGSYYPNFPDPLPSPSTFNTSFTIYATYYPASYSLDAVFKRLGVLAPLPQGIVNGGFETGNLTGWTKVPVGGATYVASSAYGMTPHSGSYFCLLWGQTQDEEIYQTLNIPLKTITEFGLWAQDTDPAGAETCVLTYSDSSTTTTNFPTNVRVWTYLDLMPIIAGKNQNLSVTKIELKILANHLIGVDDVSLISSGYKIDVALMKQFKLPYSIDDIIKKLGITQTDSIDMILQKLGAIVPYQIDVILQQPQSPQFPYSIDVVLYSMGGTGQKGGYRHKLHIGALFLVGSIEGDLAVLATDQNRPAIKGDIKLKSSSVGPTLSSPIYIKEKIVIASVVGDIGVVIGVVIPISGDIKKKPNKKKKGKKLKDILKDLDSV